MAKRKHVYNLNISPFQLDSKQHIFFSFFFQLNLSKAYGQFNSYSAVGGSVCV